MGTIEYSTLENTPFDEVREAFNHAFSYYIIPLQFPTNEQFDIFLSERGVEFKLSSGAFDEGNGPGLRQFTRIPSRAQ